MLVAGFDRMKIGCGNAFFFEPALQNSQSQRGSIHRNLQLLQHERQGADMIFMAVGDKYGPNLILILD